MNLGPLRLRLIAFLLLSTYLNTLTCYRYYFVSIAKHVFLSRFMGAVLEHYSLCKSAATSGKHQESRYCADIVFELAVTCGTSTIK